MKKLIITALIAFATTVQANPSYISSDGKSVYTEATQLEYDALSPQEKYQAVFTNATKESYDAMVPRTKVEEQQPSSLEKATQTNATERVTTDEVQVRDGIVFLPNENIPFTSRLEELYPNGEKKREVHWKDGKLSGVSIYWYKNGQKETEQNNTNGNIVSWYENGQKKSEYIHINDEIIVNTWYENGKKAQGLNDKNELVNWDENGKEISLEKYIKRFK